MGVNVNKKSRRIQIRHIESIIRDVGLGYNKFHSNVCALSSFPLLRELSFVALRSDDSFDTIEVSRIVSYDIRLSSSSRERPEGKGTKGKEGRKRRSIKVFTSNEYLHNREECKYLVT